MESISDVILFCSSFSQACVPVVQVIQQYQIPVKMVRLDTTAYREAVQNGPHFQIRAVPTLVVTHKDGNLQLFAGQQKILDWLKMAINSDSPDTGQTQSSVNSQESTYHNKETKISLSSDDEDILVPKKTKKSRKQPKSSSKPKKTSMTGGLYGSSKKKKKHAVEFYSSEEDEGVDIEFVNDGHPARPSAPPTGGLMVGSQASKSKPAKGTSIKEIAKQMEQDMKNTLGYDEKNLPRYS